MRESFGFLVFALLVGCGRSSNDATSVPGSEAPVTQTGMRNPNMAEGWAALKPMLQGTGMMAFSPITEPYNCTPGSMNGTLVLSCKVCAKMLAVDPPDNNALKSLYLEHGIFSVALKRAISAD